MSGAPRPVLPLPGPFHDASTPELTALDLVAARTMLASALVDVERGAYDDQVVGWLAGRSAPHIAVVASLLRRCWQAGAAAGRREVLDEKPLVQHLRASIANLEDDLRDRNGVVAELLTERNVARAEADRYAQALDAIVAAVAVFEGELGAGEPADHTAAVLAAVEAALRSTP